MKLNIKNYHDHFLIIDHNNEGELSDLGRAIFHQNFEFVDDVIATEDEVCIKLNQKYMPRHEELLNSLTWRSQENAKIWNLPVCFEHLVDWSEMEEKLNIDRAHILDLLLKSEYSLAMYGFLPGFSYFRGLPSELHLSRKSIPDKRMMAGTVAIGGPYLGIYAIESPGGWHNVGSCPLIFIDDQTLPPTVLMPGHQVRIIRIDQKEFNALKNQRLTISDYNINQNG